MHTFRCGSGDRALVRVQESRLLHIVPFPLLGGNAQIG